MTALDVFVFLLLIGGAAVGFVRGFVHELISLLAWSSGSRCSSCSTANCGPVSSTASTWAPLRLRCWPSRSCSCRASLLVKFLARSLGGKTRRHAVLGPVDRVLGGGFGALKGLLGATLFFLLANLATDMVYGPQADRPEWMTKSRTYPLLNASGRAIVDWVEARRLRVRKAGQRA